MHSTAQLVCLLVFVYSTNAAAVSEEDDRYNFLLQRVVQLYDRDAANQQKIQDMNAKMVAMETEFNEKMDSMTTELSQYRTGVANKGTAMTKIAFYAIVSQHYVDDIAAGQKVMFDVPYTNVGNAYNPSTGTFIAPIGGTYAFSVTLSGRKTDGSTSYFTVNVDNMLRGKLISHTLEQDSEFLVLTLRAGDSVYVTTVEGGNGILGTYYSTFSGFML